MRDVKDLKAGYYLEPEECTALTMRDVKNKVATPEMKLLKYCLNYAGCKVSCAIHSPYLVSCTALTMRDVKINIV